MEVGYWLVALRQKTDLSSPSGFLEHGHWQSLTFTLLMPLGKVVMEGKSSERVHLWLTTLYPLAFSSNTLSIWSLQWRWSMGTLWPFANTVKPSFWKVKITSVARASCRTPHGTLVRKHSSPMLLRNSNSSFMSLWFRRAASVGKKKKKDISTGWYETPCINGPWKKVGLTLQLSTAAL